MSLDKKGLSCVFCKAYLFEDDDVVHCPVCGAPHHRECYNKINHCALEELHGTADEYDIEKIRKAAEEKSEDSNAKPDTVTCPVCSEVYEKALGKCPKCSAPDFSGMNGRFIQFDFLGGVPADYKLDGDITAKEVQKFVASNTHRYLPKFAALNSKNRISWNWMAFLFPSSWMLSRKMYKSGIITGVLTIIATFLNYPLTKSLYAMGIPQTVSYAELVGWMMEKLPEIGTAVLALSLLAGLLNLTIRIVSALLGDYIYRSHVLSSIKSIKQTNEDIDYAYRKKGGVNILLFLTATMALQYIPSMIAMLI